MELKNDLLLTTLQGQRSSRPPVWMMRQAGRYLPDYLKLKERYSFFERCQNPELASEITVMPVDQVGVDAAILFSDILVVPQAMGLEVLMAEGKGPLLPHPLRSMADLARIQVPDVHERLHYVFEAIRHTLMRLEGRVPLIGFAGAPWTLLCYMVQGKGSKAFDEARAFCFAQPELAERILDMITETTIAYLKGQIQAGVHCVQVFDSWAGLLGPEEFQRWSLPYLKRITTAIQGHAPVILFAKGAWHGLEALSQSGANALGLDWCIRPQTARQLVGPQVTLQGNFDPAKLLAPKAFIQQEARNMAAAFQGGPYIANLGHGILPDVPVDHARTFVETIQSL